MPTQDAIIQFKTRAWQHAAQVSWYADRMHENRGTNRLKNEVEISLVRANVAGKRILDVGIGTGRGSLPLLRDGYSITGIDASQAMLDQCRREAGDLPIELIAADLTKLPVADELFDSAIALNVISHFPNWREALTEWTRVIKPGGRIVFDVHSADHMRAVAARSGCRPEDLLTREQLENPEHYALRIGVQDVADAATELGLSVVAIIPYGAVLGGGNLNYWLRDSLLWGDDGDRVLSWTAVDEQLNAFGMFIEQNIVARLSSHATRRFMAVLEKCDDPAVTQRTVEYHEILASLFAHEPTLAELGDVIGPDVLTWGTELSKHLEYPANRALLAMMLSSPVTMRLRGLVEELTGRELAAELYDLNERKRLEQAVQHFVRAWHHEVVDAEKFVFGGVDLIRSLECDAARDLLALEHLARTEASQ